MSSNPICPIHHVEATIKPGGVSKTTGRKYSAFYTCPSKDEETGGWCQHKFPQRPPAQALFDTAKKTQTVSDEKKNKEIRWMNAIKIASELISAKVVNADEYPTWREALEDAASYVFRTKPPEDAPTQFNEDEPPF